MKQLTRKYKVGNKYFLFDKKSLKYSFNKYREYTDEEFIEDIVDILHFATYICWLKEIPTEECLADDGIIHELVHCIKKSTRNHSDLKEIRKKFNKTLII